MAYEQPRVPIWREGNKLTDYIKELVRFLRSFTVAAWQADKLKDDQIKALQQSANGGVSEDRLNELIKAQLESAERTIIDKAFPVGRIVEFESDVDPNTLYDWQKWEQLKDRFLIGAGGSYALGSTGGEATHTLTVDEMPRHYHSAYVDYLGSGTEHTIPAYYAQLSDGSYEYHYSAEGSKSLMTITDQRGNSQAHNNMPPYLAVNMWKRTA